MRSFFVSDCLANRCYIHVVDLTFQILPKCLSLLLFIFNWSGQDRVEASRYPTGEIEFYIKCSKAQPQKLSISRQICPGVRHLISQYASRAGSEQLSKKMYMVPFLEIGLLDEDLAKWCPVHSSMPRCLPFSVGSVFFLIMVSMASRGP